MDKVTRILRLYALLAQIEAFSDTPEKMAARKSLTEVLGQIGEERQAKEKQTAKGQAHGGRGGHAVIDPTGRYVYGWNDKRYAEGLYEVDLKENKYRLIVNGNVDIYNDEKSICMCSGSEYLIWSENFGKQYFFYDVRERRKRQIYPKIGTVGTRVVSINGGVCHLGGKLYWIEVLPESRMAERQKSSDKNSPFSVMSAVSASISSLNSAINRSMNREKQAGMWVAREYDMQTQETTDKKAFWLERLMDVNRLEIHCGKLYVLRHHITDSKDCNVPVFRIDLRTWGLEECAEEDGRMVWREYAGDGAEREE